MESYFLRDSDVAHVATEDLLRLWEEGTIAIHHPGDGPADLRSLNPGDYRSRTEKNAVRTFARLAREGGYVWAQCPGAPYELVGRVDPGTKVEYVDAHWATDRADGVHPRRRGDTAVLKTLALGRAKRVEPHGLMSLRAARPRRACISEWQACGKRLASFVEDQMLALEWRELSRDLQETAATEYLRFHGHADLPLLQFLLMPVGRTLQGVDAYGITEDGKELFIQVGQGKPDFQEGTGKLAPLLALPSHDVRKVLFCDVHQLQQRDGIWLVPNQDVFDWLLENPVYCHRLFML